MSETIAPEPLISYRAAPLKGEATVPGDKSLSHRALMFSGLAIGDTAIRGLLEGEDVLNTASAMRALGTTITRDEAGVWNVQGVGVGGLAESAGVLDFGNSGTGARLMMGLVATHPLTTFFTGDASLCRRPMQRVITPLKQFGAEFWSREGRRLPLAVKGAADAAPIRYTLPVASAQVKSAVLLAGLNTPGTTVVEEPEPTRDHTERLLRFLGAPLSVEQQGSTRIISLQGQPSLRASGLKLDIPADPSSAAFPTAAALIVPHSEITLTNVCVNPLRTGLYETLREMGADITYANPREQAGEPVADIVVRYGVLKGIIVPAERAPAMIDEYPILAVIAAFAEGDTVMHGLGELRVKESDRLSAVVNGLTACGVRCDVEGDSLTVYGMSGKVPGGATVKTVMDHRIAMSFLVMGMASKSAVKVDDGAFIATSFPGFLPLMNQLGGAMHAIEEAAPHKHYGHHSVSLQPMVIAIDGPAASGKGTLARRLADVLGFGYLDTGSLYRAVGLRMVYAGQDPHDVNAAVAAAKSIEFEDLTNPRLRQERVGRAASIVAAIPGVRQALLDFQRTFATRAGGAVLDGRDIGTVVYPEADLKVFVTASLGARARRRHREIQGQGFEVIFNSVLKDLEERDQRDRERDRAPMRPADDATILDTTALSAEEVFEKVLSLAKGAAERKALNTPVQRKAG